MDSLSAKTTIAGKEVELVIIFDGELRNLEKIRNDPDMLRDYLKDPDLKFADAKSYSAAKMQKDIKEWKEFQDRTEVKKEAEEFKIEEEKRLQGLREEGKEGEERKFVPKPDWKFFRLRGFRPYKAGPEDIDTLKGLMLDSRVLRQNIPFPDYRKELQQKLEFNKKIDGLKEFSYESYKRIVLSIFSKILFNIVAETPEVLTSDRLTIEMKIMKFQHRDYYILYNQFASDTETICYYVEGIWLLHAIVLPFFILGKCDFTYVDRIWRHEFVHQVDTVKEYMVWDLKYVRKIQKVSRRKSMYCLNYLYHSMFNLRQEGLAEFATRMNSEKIELNMTGIHAYNEKMKELSRQRLKQDCSKMYEQEIGAGNASPSGEYTNGRNMCLTIAMWIAKKEKKYYTIIENDKNKTEHTDYQFKDLNSMLNRNPLINIKGLNFPDERDMNYRNYLKDKDSWILPKTIDMIRPYVHYYFVKLYEGACDDLGIEEKNRVMTSRRFYGLVKGTIQAYKDYKKEKLEKAGFIYEDDRPEVTLDKDILKLS